MSALLTNKQRVLNALNTKAQSNLYIGIGRTTAWDDENNPDVPSVTDTEIEELIYIKKIGVKHLVVLDAVTPDVEVAGNSYRYVSDNDVYDENAYFLYVSASFDYVNVCPTSVTFRQIGLLLDPKDSEGDLLEDEEYLAAAVTDQGKLLYIDNRIAISRDISQSEKFEIIIVF